MKIQRWKLSDEQKLMEAAGSMPRRLGGNLSAGGGEALLGTACDGTSRGTGRHRVYTGAGGTTQTPAIPTDFILNF